MQRFAPAAAVAVAAALLASGAPARADLVRLFDGKTIEGKATLSGNKWTVKGYKGKSVTYASSEVKFREPGDCSWEVAAKMLKEIPPDASDALFVQKHLEVARYLKERRVYCPDMEELELKEYEAVLKKVPNDEEARTGLGHVKWAQWWFKSEKERDAFRKGAPPSQMEPLGYLKYKKTGMWEVKEDVEAMDAGKVKYKGKWMTEEEKKAAQGYVKDEKGNWVLARDVNDKKRLEEIEKALKEKPVTVVSSRHFRFISWFNAGETAEMKELAEKTYEKHRELIGFPLAKGEDAEDDMFPEGIEAFLLIDTKRKDAWVDAYGKELGWPDELIQHRREPGSAGWHGLGASTYLLISCGPTEKNRPRDTEADGRRTKADVASMVARLIFDRVRPGSPAWLEEGNAFLGEIRMNETADCCYVSMTKYHEEVANKQGSKAKYFDFMKKQVAAGLDRSMRQLFTLELNDLDWADNVKSWSFLEFLVAGYRTEFQQMLRVPMVDVERITPAQIQAAIDAKKPKDPSAAPTGAKPKDEGAAPKEPVTVRGPGAQEVTPGSKEERAMHAAMAEQWLADGVKKDLDTLEKEWKAWLMTK